MEITQQAFGCLHFNIRGRQLNLTKKVTKSSICVALLDRQYSDSGWEISCGGFWVAESTFLWKKEQQPFLHSLEEIRYQFMATPCDYSSKSEHFSDILQTVFEDGSINE